MVGKILWKIHTHLGLITELGITTVTADFLLGKWHKFSMGILLFRMVKGGKIKGKYVETPLIRLP